MSQKDVERVEQHTGMDAEELTDEEMTQAMGELGIEDQPVTSADQENTGGGTAPAAAPASSGTSDLDQLQKLGELHASGILTDEEFAAKKAQILGL